MADEAKIPARKPRADAERNRLRLIETAKRAFAEKGTGVALEDIARAAGVGIGTLYRHFPTRDALVEQVYRNEIEQLAAAAERLAVERPPVAALREWMLLFVDYFVTKQSMGGALAAMVGGTAELYAASGRMLNDALALLTGRAIDSGEIRLTVPPLDLLRAVVGVSGISAEPGWQDNARRMVDILIAGIRVGD